MSPSCPDSPCVCSGKLIAYEEIPASRRDVVTRISICKSCEHNGLHTREGQTYEGCGLLAKPCSIERKRMDAKFTGPGDRQCWQAGDDPMPNRFPTLAAPYLDEQQLIQDAALLAGKVASLNIRAVIGVPRSGMFPATYIATRLGLPLGTIADRKIVITDTGRRLRGRSVADGVYLIVEDSTATGTSINELKAALSSELNIRYSALYATPEASKKVDFYGRLLPLPHWFSWNFFGNQSLFKQFNVGTDFDGVLCPDCSLEDDDDGHRYVRWMRSVRPLIVSRHVPIPFIITARLEKYRSETERWLRQHKFQWGELVMGPWADLRERARHCIGTWKREQAQRLGCRLFVESNDHQARIISSRWDHPVISVDGKTSYVKGVGPQWPSGIPKI